ncbi:hypothetical protein F4818DRAFT_435568 [Hypoxylon cercidicola]|nr:hypothetical protein F4818DRAFT_435568 [Hypoxylon cercidicola]
MSYQPTEQERALEDLFENVKSQPKKQNGPAVDESTRLTRDRIWKLWEGYVRNSLQLRFVLDARERAKVRTVRNASTVVVIWRALVAAADFYIMDPKRQAQPKKARLWTLQWLHDVEGRLAGPGFKIVLWIFEELVLKENLLIDSPYQKVGATPSAVRKILFNLWVKAAYIPC